MYRIFFWISVFIWSNNVKGTIILKDTLCSGPEIERLFLDSLINAGHDSVIITQCPDKNIAPNIQWDFKNFKIDPRDTVWFYDGQDLTAPFMGDAIQLFGLQREFTLKSSIENATGCLTLLYKQDPNSDLDAWSFSPSCFFPCQPFNIKEINNIIEDSICPVTELTFEVEGKFGSIQNYPQADSLVEYVWYINRTEVGRAKSLTYTFDDPGGFSLNVVGRDSNNCLSEIDQQIAIKVSGPPQFAVGSAIDFEFCQYDTVAFSAYKSIGGITQDSAINLISPEYRFDLAFQNGDTLLIPDADGNRFESTLFINQFKNSDTLRSGDDLKNICVNMEHSYLHDLVIQIQCPSGDTATVYLRDDKNNSSSRQFLGQPNSNDDSNPISGKGFQYCWNKLGTENWNNFLLDKGQEYTLPEGNYLPFDSYEKLIGCPLNGEWRLIVKDELPGDNGFIFGWSLEFEESFYPGKNPFSPEIVEYKWTTPSGTNPTDSTLRWENFYHNPGQSFFNLNITDDFGCSYDSILQFSVLPEFHPDCRDCEDLLSGDLKLAYCNNDLIPLEFEGRPSKIDFVTFENYNSDSILISDIKSDSLEQICFSGTFDLRTGINIYAIKGNDTIPLLDTIGSEDSILINRCIQLTNQKYTPEGIWKIALNDPTKAKISFWSISLTNNFSVDYQWNNSLGLSCEDCPNPTFFPDSVSLDSNTYILTATDNFGCNISSELTTIKIPIYDSLVVDTILGGRGEIIFFWNAPAPNLTYEYNLGFGWDTIKDSFYLEPNRAPGDIINFKVRVQSTNSNCPQPITEVSVLYNPCELTTVILDRMNPTCFNSMDAGFRVQSTGGVFPMRYKITGSMAGTDSIFKNLAPGEYWVEAIDNLGCIDSIPISFTAPNPISSIINLLQEVSCHDESDGIIVAEGFGGTGQLEYYWNNLSADNDTLNGIGKGEYDLKIVDSLKCSLDTTYQLIAPTILETNASFQLPACFGEMNGQITVKAQGGVGPYSYEWENGTKDSILRALAAGNYCLTVTDANGCIQDTCFELLNPLPLKIDSFTVENPTCFGDQNGVAEIFVSGGTGPLAYSWDDPLSQINARANNLYSGEYVVSVSDQNSCIDSVTVVLTDPEELQINLDITEVSCFGLNDGAIRAIVSGGSSPYQYIWSNRSNDDSITGLAGGAYLLTVTDLVGCQKQVNGLVDSPNSSITGSFLQVKEGCYGESGNIAEVNASGGYGGYTFEWSNGKTGMRQTDLDTIEYSITVRDSSGCEIEVKGTPKDFPPLIPNLIVTPPSCLGFEDGKLAINFTNVGQINEDELTFEWSNGKTGPIITNLAGDSTYSVSVTHINGCKSIVSRYLRLPTDIDFELRSNPVSCFGGSDGKASIVNLFSEDPNFTFNWDFGTGNQTNQEATGLKAGNYSVTITNGSGCRKIGQVNVASPSALRMESFLKNNDCHGDSLGKIELNLSGGTGNYFYSWSNGFTDRINERLKEGNYFVSVRDGNNCEITDSFTISQPDMLEVDAVSEPVNCFGNRDGKLEALPFGGTPPYRYSLDGNSFTNSAVFGGLSSGAYQVWVRDANGCVSNIGSSIGSPPRFLVDIGPTNYKIKLGDELALTVSNIHGQSPFEYEWISSVDGVLNCLECPTVIVNTPKLTFIEVVVTDSKGCMASDKTTIAVDKNRIIEVPTGFSPNGDGLNDILLVHGTEGTEILSFRIFDRWGELIFESGEFEVNDPVRGWDGKFREEDLGPGIYLWQVEARFIDGIVEFYKGTTTLIR